MVVISCSFCSKKAVRTKRHLVQNGQEIKFKFNEVLWKILCKSAFVIQIPFLLTADSVTIAHHIAAHFIHVNRMTGHPVIQTQSQTEVTHVSTLCNDTHIYGKLEVKLVDRKILNMKTLHINIYNTLNSK
jgi:hypothetical protein